MKLTIITINFNNLEGLKRTFESVFIQTYQEFEFIVIDGGSTDGSKEYIELNADRISYWVSEPDKGIYNAMNKGIEASNGEYLNFMNSGDEFYNDTALKNVITFIKNDNNETILYYGNLYLPIENKIYTYPEKITYNFLLSSSLPHQATFIHNRFFKNLGLYNEENKIVSDWEHFIVGICKQNYLHKKMDFIVSKFFTDGISGNYQLKELQAQERIKTLKKHFPNIYDESFNIENYHKNNYIISKLKKSRLFSILQKLGFFSYIKL